MVVKILAVLICLFGLATAFTGFSSLQIVDSSIAIMQQMREAGSQTLEGIDLAQMRFVLYVTAALTLLVGLLSLTSGIGMLFRKNWARLWWVGIVVLMALWIIYSFVISSINRGLGMKSVLVNALILLLLAAIFYFFSKEKTKGYFKVN